MTYAGLKRIAGNDERSSAVKVVCIAVLISQVALAQPRMTYFGVTNAASYYSEEGPERTVVVEIARVYYRATHEERWRCCLPSGFANACCLPELVWHDNS